MNRKHICILQTYGNNIVSFFLEPHLAAEDLVWPLHADRALEEAAAAAAADAAAAVGGGSRGSGRSSLLLSWCCWRWRCSRVEPLNLLHQFFNVGLGEDE